MDQDVCDRLCAALASGLSLRKAAAAEGIDPATPLKWCEVSPDFEQQYARARETGYKLLADEIIEISDEIHVEPVPGDDSETPEVRIDSTAVARNRLRVDSRKWMLSKMLPKLYGDKIDLNHGGTVTFTAVERTVKDPVK